MLTYAQVALALHSRNFGQENIQVSLSDSPHIPRGVRNLVLCLRRMYLKAESSADAHHADGDPCRS